MKERSRSPDETWTEEEVFDLLTQSLQGTSEGQHYKRIRSLDELNRRAKTDSLRNIDKTCEIVLNTARRYSGHHPESSLIPETLVLLIRKNNEAFQKVLDGLEGEQLFFTFSKIVPHLDQEKKKKSVLPLISFLMSRDVLNAFGVNEAYECLVTMDSKEIRSEIKKHISPHLDSLKIPALVFAVRITSKLGDVTVIPEMLKVFERSFRRYYGGHEREIQKEICTFFKRIPDKRSLSFILKVAQLNRSTESSEALASIADAYPEVLEEIYQFLEKVREPQNILIAFTKMKKASVEFDRVLNPTIKHLGNLSISIYLKEIALKIGKSTKPTLLRIAKSKKSLENEFALNCLEKIGVSFDEISKIFKKSPVLEVYDFFFENKKKLIVDEIWKDKSRLGEQIPRKWSKIEYLIQNIFSAFGFLTIYVEPSGREGVDIIAFSPNTFDLYVIGCTTGVLKDDIPKLSATILEMERELKELFAKYRVIPMIFTSKLIDLTTKHSEAKGMAIFTYKMIGNLLRMLRTGKTSDDLNMHIRQNIIWGKS